MSDTVWCYTFTDIHVLRLQLWIISTWFGQSRKHKLQLVLYTSINKLGRLVLDLSLVSLLLRSSSLSFSLSLQQNLLPFRQRCRLALVQFLLLHGQHNGTQKQHNGDGSGIHSGSNQLSGTGHDLVSVDVDPGAPHRSDPRSENDLVLVVVQGSEGLFGQGHVVPLSVLLHHLSVGVVGSVHLSIKVPRALVGKEGRNGNGGHGKNTCFHRSVEGSKSHWVSGFKVGEETDRNQTTIKQAFGTFCKDMRGVGFSFFLGNDFHD
ncbi:hypothetical protein CLUG_01941 [Clavispora lusitaniae ATCC 42720]|uniref:Uncharacterized protein n=1 Tax=Clavispora lusitaniae (strain ATCC 42720) TaxID=306902 RepID=C4Y159_CLAL4|nr:uncharacterized protein CLUG_01941 [Clavispora lusitaniae ATCC 42720]EEQ37819.1 hypothetical protein CLUG_01941 [Clavispora lusitaniae ATCC 42720]